MLVRDLLDLLPALGCPSDSDCWRLSRRLYAAQAVRAAIFSRRTSLTSTITPTLGWRQEGMYQLLGSASMSAALLMASVYGHTAIVQALLADRRTRYVANKDGQTALMFACRHPSTIAVLLADSRTEINRQTNLFKETALMCASSSGYLASVQVLLADSRVQLNAMNRDGSTALDMARVRKHKEVAELLKAKGATGKWRLW